MPMFLYKARNATGSLVSETVDFSNEGELRAHLRANNLFVTEMSEIRARRASISRKRVGLTDLIIFVRHLRTMIMAGMPLVSALEALATQSGNARMSEILADVTRNVATGISLGNSLAEHGDTFPEVVQTPVRAGEEGGRLPESLAEAARQLELQMEIRQKLITAMMYPTFTLVATVGTVTAMMIFIVPTFAKIYHDLNAPLPSMTRILMMISELMVAYGWLVALAAGVGLVALRRYNKTPEGRMHIDGMKLRAPVFGNLFKKSASANLTSSLAGLLDSGVSLIAALQTASRVCGNEVMGRSVQEAARNLALGRRLSTELEKGGHFPTMVTRMISMAEETGTLPEVLRQVAAGYIEEVEYAIRRIMTVIEPAMVLIVGGIVGFVLVSLYLPIFNLGNVFLSGS